MEERNLNETRETIDVPEVESLNIGIPDKWSRLLRGVRESLLRGMEEEELQVTVTTGQPINRERTDLQGEITGRNVFRISAMSPSEAQEVLRRATDSRFRRVLSRQKGFKKIESGPSLAYLPAWVVEGAHECVYLRNTTYRVPIAPDVLAVEVDGKHRDISIERGSHSNPVLKILRKIPWVRSFLTFHKRYVTVDKVVELAQRGGRGVLCVSGNGVETDVPEELVNPEWRIERVAEDAIIQPNSDFIRSQETTETVVQRLREKVVRTPQSFSQILSDKLEVTRFDLYYVPYYLFTVTNRSSLRNVAVHGVTGQVADKRTTAFLFNE